MPRSPELRRNLDLQGTIREMRQPLKVPDTGWIEVGGTDEIAPPFENGWGNVGGTLAKLAFYMASDGEIRMRGHFVGGAVNTTIFTLPVGYRPEKRETFLLPNDDIGYAVMQVDTDGKVSLIRISV